MWRTIGLPGWKTTVERRLPNEGASEARTPSPTRHCAGESWIFMSGRWMAAVDLTRSKRKAELIGGMDVSSMCGDETSPPQMGREEATRMSALLMDGCRAAGAV